MQNRYSPSKKLFFFIVLFLQTWNASGSELLRKNMLQLVGNFLEPESAHKITKTSKQWNKVKIYENIFPNEREIAVFRHVNTGEIMWETIKLTEFRKPIPQQVKVVSYVLQNDSSNWKDLFMFIGANRYELIEYESPGAPFLKKLMLEIAENVSVAIGEPSCGNTSLMLAAEIDDTDSILTLVKRDADVNQQNDYGQTALHVSAQWGNLNACEILLKSNAHIDIADHDGYTPLHVAAGYSRRSGNKSMLEFLIENGADVNILDPDGMTAFQRLRFQTLEQAERAEIRNEIQQLEIPEQEKSSIITLKERTISVLLTGLLALFYSILFQYLFMKIKSYF